MRGQEPPPARAGERARSPTDGSGVTTSSAPPSARAGPRTRAARATGSSRCSSTSASTTASKRRPRPVERLERLRRGRRARARRARARARPRTARARAPSQPRRRASSSSRPCPQPDLQQPAGRARGARARASSRRAVARRPGLLGEVAGRRPCRGRGRAAASPAGSAGWCDGAAARAARRGRRAARRRGRSARTPPPVSARAGAASAAAPAGPPQMPHVPRHERASLAADAGPYDCRRARGPGSPSSSPPTTRRTGIARHGDAACAAGSRRPAAPWEIVVVDNASTDGTAERARAAARRRAHARAAQRRQPRQGLLGAPRDARRARRAAAALRRRLRSLAGVAAGPAVAALDEGADVVVGSRLAPRRARRAPPAAAAPDRRAHVRRSCAALVLREPTRDLFCGFKLWRADGRGGRLRARRGSTAGRSTPRCWRSPARSASGSREVGIAWSDREGSRLSMLRVLVPVVRELRRRAPRPRRSARASRATRAGRPARRGPGRTARRRRVDRAELALLAALGALAVAPLAGLLLRVALQGRPPRRAATASSCSTSCSTSTGCARRASTCSIAQPLRPRARAALASCIPALLVSGALQRARARAWRPPTWCGSRSRCSRCGPARWRGAERFLDAAARRRLAAVALALFFASPVAGAGRLDGPRRRSGRELRLRLPRRRADGRQLPLGLLVHGDRGRAGAARAAGPRARPDRARPPPPGCWSRGSSPGRARPTCSCCSRRRPCCWRRRGRAPRSAAWPSRPRRPRRRSSTTCALSQLDAAWELAGRAERLRRLAMVGDA